MVGPALGSSLKARGEVDPVTFQHAEVSSGVKLKDVRSSLHGPGDWVITNGPVNRTARRGATTEVTGLRNKRATSGHKCHLSARKNGQINNQLG